MSSVSEKGSQNLRKPTKLVLEPDLTDPSPRLWEFLGMVPDWNDLMECLYPVGPEWSPVHVSIREWNERLYLSLEVGDRTTGDDLENAGRLVTRLRDRLLQFQGPSDEDDDLIFWEDLLWRKRRGASWSELAEYINGRVGSRLVACYEQETDREKAVGAFESLESYCGWAHVQNSPSLVDAVHMLKLIKPAHTDIEDVCRRGSERIARGKAPFDKGQPIGSDIIRDRLRSRSDSKLHRMSEETEQ